MVIICRRGALARVAAQCDLPPQVVAWGGQAKGRWVAVERLGSVPMREESDPLRLVSEGWDGSYHDAHYRPVLCCGGRTPARARRALAKTRASLSCKDSSALRHDRRNMVRSGD
jgi:hypothetical protein